jgi:LAO/AO transport system kinase
VLTCSATTGEGIREVWQMVLEHRRLLESNGYLAERRSLQALQWMNELVSLGLEDLFRSDPSVAARLPALQAAVRQGRATSFAAARELLDLFYSKNK